MLTFFIQRWQVETTFEEARTHLGMETQRQWNDQAIARTTPLVLALFTIVALLAHTLIGKPICRIRQSAWYSKTALLHESVEVDRTYCLMLRR